MKYDEYANLIGFNKIDNVYVRYENDFFLYLKDWEYSLFNIPSFYIPLRSEIHKSELKKLQESAGGNVGALYSLGGKNNTVIISFAEGNKLKDNVILEINQEIKNVCIELKKMGYSKMECCPICHTKADYNVFGNDYCPIHDDCKNRYLEDLVKLNIRSKKFNKKDLLALLLGILLSVVGMLPALLLCLFNHNYFSGIICFIPIGCALGYYLSKCNSKKITRYILSTFVFLFIFCFTIFAIINMASFYDESILNYCFTGKMLGLRKIIFAVILSFGGFGGTKFIDKFKINYQKELDKFKS